MVFRGGRSVVQVKNIVNIVTSCSGQKMPMPGMPEAVFLEGLIVRNTALDTFAKVIDGRGSSRRSDSRCGCWSLSAPPNLEGVIIKGKPMRNSGRGMLTEPREEGVEFLHLD